MGKISIQDVENVVNVNSHQGADPIDKQINDLLAKGYIIVDTYKESLGDGAVACTFVMGTKKQPTPRITTRPGGSGGARAT